MEKKKLMLFGEDDFTPMGEGEGAYFLLDVDMRGRCAPVFDACANNHDVEDVLRENDAIILGVKTDTEAARFVARCADMDSVRLLSSSLNAHLVGAADTLGLEILWPESK